MMRKLTIWALCSAIYALAISYGQMYAAPISGVSLIWPASGILTAALFLAPFRYWPAIVANALAVDVIVRRVLMDSPLTDVTTFLAHEVEALAAALVLRLWLGEEVRWMSLRTFVRLLVAGCLVGATLGATLGTLHLLGTDQSYWLSWRIVWLADSKSIVTLAPLIVGLRRESAPLPVSRTEGVFTLLVSLAVVVFVFATSESLARPFVVYIPIIWVAVRLGPLATSFTLAVASYVAFTLNLYDTGPFNFSGNIVHEAVATQMFLLALTVSAMVVATHLADQQRTRLNAARAIIHLDEAESNYEVFFENTKVPILVTDGESICKANRAACTLFGRQRKDMLAPLESFSNAGSENRPFSEIWSHGVKGNTRLNWTAKNENSDVLHLEVFISLMEGHSDGIYQVVLRDRTREIELRSILEKEKEYLYEKVRQATSELEETNSVLARSNEDTERFLTTVAHELRTPLSGVLSLGETLREGLWGPLNDKQRRALKHIDESGQHLSDLVSDTLEMARVQSEQRPLRLTHESLLGLCKTTLRLVGQKATNSEVNLEIGPVDDIIVHTDARFCKQILLNLLTNAIQHTRPGGTVRLQACLTEKTVRFTVSDKGSGIPEELKDQLFEPFVRADSSIPGYGLGLPLVHKLTTALGGAVVFESEIGTGTRFIVSLPARSDCNPDSFSARAIPEKKPLVALSCSTSDTVKNLSVYLQKRMYQVTRFQDDRELMDIVAATRPHLVIMDCTDTGQDPMKVLKALSQTMEPLAPPPIMLLTEQFDEKKKRSWIKAGAATVLPMSTPLPDLESIALKYSKTS